VSFRLSSPLSDGRWQQVEPVDEAVIPEQSINVGFLA
jgi:hypothetical protein